MTGPSSRARIVKPLVIIAVLVALAVAAYLLAPRILGRTEAGLAAAGTVEATEVQLGFQSAGRIESLGPREGERVKAGAVMGQLDRAEMLARREQAQAQREESSGVHHVGVEPDTQRVEPIADTRREFARGAVGQRHDEQGLGRCAAHLDQIDGAFEYAGMLAGDDQLQAGWRLAVKARGCLGRSRCVGHDLPLFVSSIRVLVMPRGP